MRYFPETDWNLRQHIWTYPMQQEPEIVAVGWNYQQAVKQFTDVTMVVGAH